MELKPYDLPAIAGGLKELKISDQTTNEEADAAFKQLAQFNQCQLNIGRFVGQTPWERHRLADELLYFVDGEVEITLLSEDGPVEVTAKAGSIFVVPQGYWHRQFSANGVTALYATPLPTDVSFADDPRLEIPQ